MLSHSDAGTEPLALCMTQEPPQTLSKHCCQGANRLSTFSRAEAATFHGWLAQTTSSTLMPLEFTGGVSVLVWRRHHVIKASFTFMLGWFPHYQVGYIQNIKTASKPAGFYGSVLRYLPGFLTSDGHALFRGNEVLSPAWLCSQVTYRRVWKETKKHKWEWTWRVRCPTESHSATTDDQPTRKRRRGRKC